MMRCGEVSELLVALQDGELSPGATALIQEHLEYCTACTTLADALTTIDIQPCLVVSPAVQARLEARISGAVAHEFAHPSPVQRTSPWLGWLRQDLEVSVASVALITMVLSGVLGLGLAHIWTDHLHDMPVAIAQTPAVPGPSVPVSAVAEIPADQYKPAAYTPGEDVLH